MIKVTVQTEKRLAAINNLSIAVRKVAEALALGTHVTVSDCTFTGAETAISIDTAEKVTETKIHDANSHTGRTINQDARDS